MELYFSFFAFIVSFISLFIVLHRIAIADTRETHEHPSSDASIIAPHVTEREESFDARIAQIKEELALRTATQTKGHIADELDPNVKNLPHHTLDMQRDAEPEYAD